MTTEGFKDSEALLTSMFLTVGMRGVSSWDGWAGLPWQIHSILQSPKAFGYISLQFYQGRWHFKLIYCLPSFGPCFSQPTNHAVRALSNPVSHSIKSRISVHWPKWINATLTLFLSLLSYTLNIHFHAYSPDFFSGKVGKVMYFCQSVAHFLMGHTLHLTLCGPLRFKSSSRSRRKER